MKGSAPCNRTLIASDLWFPGNLCTQLYSARCTFTKVIALRPAEDIDMTGNASTYTVSLMIFTIKDRLKHLLWQISELKARIATGQEVDSQDVAENVKKLAEASRSRDELLRRAQRARECRATGSHERFTFLAVGVTGTGKSELCRWMTGNAARPRGVSGRSESGGSKEGQLLNCWG